MQVFSLSDQRLVVLEITVTNMPSDLLHPDKDGDDAHAAQLLISLPKTLSYAGSRIPPQVWAYSKSHNQLEQVFVLVFNWLIHILYFKLMTINLTLITNYCDDINDLWTAHQFLLIVFVWYPNCRWGVKRTRMAPKLNVTWETLWNEILR